MFSKISKLERLPCVVRHFVVVSQIFESNLEKDFSHITYIFKHKGTVLHSCYISIQPLTVICYREILLQVESHQIFVLISLKILTMFMIVDQICVNCKYCVRIARIKFSCYRQSFFTYIDLIDNRERIYLKFM